MSSSPQQPTYIIPPPAGANWKTPALIGALVLLGATNIYLFTQIESLKTDSKTQMTKLSSDLNGAIDRMRADSSTQVQHSRRTIEGLQDQLASSRHAADVAVGQAKIDAQRRVEALGSRLTEAQAQETQAINAVKQTADTATTKIADVTTDVGTVKTDVQNTKTQLDQTVANLKRVSGDVDGHTSLIATNGKELDALRQLGERNYSEFTLPKNKQPTRVGDIMVKLNKVDVKHNRFTLTVIADDITTEKKDKTVNEPIQFLTKKARQPYEIVVNSVKKDTIVGYLATPKVLNPRSGT